MSIQQSVDGWIIMDQQDSRYYL